MFFSASLCGFLYLRMLCAHQCQIADAQPVPVATVLDNPTVVVVISKPQGQICMFAPYEKATI